MCEIGKGNSWDDKKNKEEEGDKVEKEIVKKRVWCQAYLDTKLVCQTGVAKLSFHKEY